MAAEDARSIRDNETKLLIASLNNKNDSDDDGIQDINPLEKEKLLEDIRQFDENLKFEREKLSKEIEVKLKDIQAKNKKSNTTK